MLESVSRRAFGVSSGTYNVRASELSKNKKVNTISATVTFLDDTQHCFQIEKNAKGNELIDMVFQYLELVEKEYFGLQYTENGAPPGSNNSLITRWLDGHKRIRRQIGFTPVLWLGVRFWVEEPAKLEASTRRLMCLQIRRLFRDGRLQAPRPARLLLASYQAQADYGDWTINSNNDIGADCGIEEVEDVRRVRELHRLHRGQSKAIADLHYLEHARRLDRYGVDVHPVKDSNGKDISIGVTSQGLVVYQNTIRINMFSWAKIVKISFKKKQFFIQLKREASESYDTVVGFNTSGLQAAKVLWRSCVEQHSFHRLQRTPAAPKYPSSLHRFFIRSPRRKETDDNKNNGNTTFSRGGLARVQEGQAAPLPRAAWTAHMSTDHRASDDEGGFLERALRVPLGYADEDDDDEEDDLGVEEAPIDMDGTSPLPELTETVNVAEDHTAESGLVVVRLTADAAGRYGFNVRGGADLDAPVVVSRVAPSSSPSTHQGPHLQEGDQVVAINNVSVDRLRHEQVVQLIRSSRGSLTLTLRPNAEYLCCEEEEPVVQYVAEGGVSEGGDVGWRQALLLLADGLSGAALQQFERLPRRAEHAVTVARLPTNQNKNRYRDIAPYDCNRVILTNGSSGDYINASFINLEIPNTSVTYSYIATQGPLPNTVNDFWQMVMECGSTLIVMLGALAERGRPKCHQYWAGMGRALRPGGATGIRIQTLAELPDPSAACIHRHLLLSDSSGRSRAIHHLQYLAWPDHGVPAAPDTFLALVGRVGSLRPLSAPAIVHCSAGVGRTGALILMDYALALLRHAQPVYPLDIVRCLRDQRPLCVQNSNQYKFVCECIGCAAQAMGLLPPETSSSSPPEK